MKRVTIPQPPDPSGFPNPVAWQRAAFDWMKMVAQLSNDANRVNASPIGQQFVATDFTTETTVTGTTTGTDLSNVVASLVAGFTAAGYIAPVQKRTSE